jgi:HSP20 family molecular chaperone IbpA
LENKVKMALANPVNGFVPQKPSEHFFAQPNGQHHIEDQYNGIISQVHCDKNKYQVTLDVKHFKPDELQVKTADHYITVEGHHEERPDEHGYIIRSFKRRFDLPDTVEPETVESNVSADGILKLQALCHLAIQDRPPISESERQIPIRQIVQPSAALRLRRGKKDKPRRFRKTTNKKWCEDMRG